MHPADQYEAFAKLHGEEGMSAEDIAARFGVTAAVVRQRLKLGAVMIATDVGSRYGDGTHRLVASRLLLPQVAEVVHGAPYRFSDPARFSIAHGGKDRHPYPVPLKVYDHTIGVLKNAVQKAKLGQSEELAAIKRLDEQARWLERHASGPSVEALFAEERARSHQYGGRSVYGAEPPPNQTVQRMGERTEYGVKVRRMSALSR